MSRGTREARSLLAALAIHGALLALLSLWASRESGAVVVLHTPRPASAADEIDVDWSTSEPAPAAALPELPQRSASQPARHAGPAATRAAAPEDASNTSAELAPAEPAAPVAAAPSISPHPVDLGLDSNGWQRWLPATPSEAPPTAARAPRALFRMPRPSKNGGIQEGLEAQDRARGMGSSGPVLRALFEASHGDRAPATGLAHFNVTVLDTGAVEVSLRDATTELDSWRTVAAEAAARLRKTPPRVPKDRKGVHLLLEISAENQLPNGLRQAQLSGPHVELAPPKLRSTAKAQKNLEDLNPLAGEHGAREKSPSGERAIVELPGVYVAQQGSVCGYKIGLSVLGPNLQGGCDLSNLGAKPVRMVHTRVLEEAAF